MEVTGEANGGEHRRPTPGEVGYVVRELRKYFEWKQLALAQEAGVTERTIQRIEEGEKVGDDTLRKVAKALRLREDAFTAPTYHPSAAELEELARTAREDYMVADAYDLSGQDALDGILNAHGHLIDDRAVEDTLAEEVAALKDNIQDYGDIYDDLTNVQRLEARRKLLELIRNIERKGYKARWARYTTADNFIVAVLMFFPATTEDDQFRKLIVPRRFCQMLAGQTI